MGGVVPQHAIDCCARRARELGEAFLGEWDDDLGFATAAVDRSEVAQSPPDACICVMVERFHEPVIHGPNAVCEKPDQDVIDEWIARAELAEVRPVDGPRLGGFKSSDGRGSDGVVADERHLAEGLAWPAHCESGRVSAWGDDADEEAAGFDQVKRVGRISLVKHNFAWTEAATASCGDEPPDHVVGGAAQ